MLSMTKVTWVDIGEDARRQYIDANAVFREWEHTLKEVNDGAIAAKARLASLTIELNRHRRLNWALRVGRVPEAGVLILKRIGGAGFSNHVIAMGPQSLFAYAAAAGIHLTNHVPPVLDLVTQEDVQQSLVRMIRSVGWSFNLTEDGELIDGKGYRIRIRAGYEDVPTMSAVVISTLGQMSRMRTLHPLHRKDYWLQPLVEEYLPNLA